jgi:imidazole glycerol-phosphate synthase subunit HisF
MLNRRIIGVVTVRDGWAVQSFGYGRWLPMGKPECVVENLDRWGADEILILSIDRSRRGLGPDFPTLERLARLNLATPLIYGGGIRSADDGVSVVQLGADRVCVDALLRDDLPAVLELSRRLGAQAIVAALPLSAKEGSLLWRDYRRQADTPLDPAVLAALHDGAISEALLIDWQHEGSPAAFDPELVRLFPARERQLIAFGGLSEPGQLAQVLAHPNVTAVGVGNFLSYREHAIQALKSAITGQPLRPAAYLRPARSCPEPA